MAREIVQDLVAYPNPTNGQLELGFSLRQRGKAVLEWYDVRGNRVGRKALGKLGVGEHREMLSLEGLADGVYVVRLTVKDDFAQARVVKRD